MGSTRSASSLCGLITAELSIMGGTVYYLWNRKRAVVAGRAGTVPLQWPRRARAHFEWGDLGVQSELHPGMIYQRKIGAKFREYVTREQSLKCKTAFMPWLIDISEFPPLFDCFALRLLITVWIQH